MSPARRACLFVRSSLPPPRAFVSRIWCKFQFSGLLFSSNLNCVFPTLISRHFTLIEDERRVRPLLCAQYLESCSRFEKTVDIRLKEIRLLRANAREDPAADGRVRRSTSVSKGKPRKQEDKRRQREKTQVREKNEQFRTKSRTRRTAAREDSFFANDVDLMESQTEYFRAVERVRKELK